MSRARPRRARSRRGRAGLGGGPAPPRGRRHRRRPGGARAACTSRRAGWSASTAGWRRPSSGRLRPSARRGIRVQAPPSVGSRRLRRRTSRARVRRSSSPTSGPRLPRAALARPAAARRAGAAGAPRARHPPARRACPLPAPAVAERLGPEGRRAWQLARGGRRARVRGRRPPAEIVESLEFPEAVGNELTLRRALATLLDRVLARPERRDRFVRKVAIAARLVGGASWRRTLTLREPSAERDSIRIALGPKLAEVPAPVVELRLELVEVSEEAGRQLALVEPSGAEARARLQEGLRQVRAIDRRRLRLHSRGGGAVVADSRGARAVRSAGRVNEPRPALVEAHADGSPKRVNREGVVLVREEWRVVDRWWTEEPLSPAVLRRRPRVWAAGGRLPGPGAAKVVYTARRVVARGRARSVRDSRCAARGRVGLRSAALSRLRAASPTARRRTRDPSRGGRERS